MEGEKRPPHAQLLSGETRASACQPSTTQAHTVAFSVPEHPGAEVVHKTHSPIKTPVLYHKSIFVLSFASEQVESLKG